ncbi:hypothetical protein Glove_70g12 [Diversispora epigaea]|uniref:Uncharacterized protein n=1 Tax=Diversispora epigaea TaxID=1348612 RepID=A0A397JGV4_9GLOM|nr:hypothetical protein Glove_70g12 [Diversispora epigaea]
MKVFGTNNLRKYYVYVGDNVPITRRDIKILLHHLEEQNEIIRRLDTEVSYVRKLLEKGGMGDFTSTDEFIKKFINAITKYSITKKIYASENELKEAASHIGYKEFPDYFEDWDQKRWSFYYDTKISSKLKAKHHSVPITRRDIKILLHHLEEQNEIIRRLDTEVSYVRKLLEKGGMGDFTSTDEFIKKFINAITKYSITKKIYASENELKEAASHIGYKEFPDYFEDWDQKRWSFYYDTKISSKTIFITFGENDLPKITTKSSADVIKNWKESYEIKNAYRKFNDDVFCSQIFQRCWTSRPSEEQSAFTISVIKYIFNPNIYSIQIKDEGIHHYMKKTQEKMNANEKIQFLEEKFNEEEEEGEEEDEEGEKGEEGEKEITQEVTEEIKGSGKDEEGEVLATGFAIR